MGGPSDRRAPRIPSELEVSVIGTKGSTTYASYDISRGGIFIKTDAPKSLRQLIRLQISIDDGKPPIEVHGMIVRATSSQEAEAQGEPAGMGIEFIAFGGQPRQRWEDFLRTAQLHPKVSSSIPGFTPAAAAVASPAPLDPISDAGISQVTGQAAPDVRITRSKPKKQKLVRYVFPVPLDTVDQLYEIYERDFEAGLMFLYTRDQIPIGERVTARIIHPINLEEFDIHGKVKQFHGDLQYPGLTLALRPSTLARREKFRAFIEAGLPEEDLAVELED